MGNRLRYTLTYGSPTFVAVSKRVHQWLNVLGQLNSRDSQALP